MTGLGGLLLIVALAASAPDTVIRFHQTIEVDQRLVRLDQIADLSVLPVELRDRAGRVVVAVVPAGRSSVVLYPRDLTERARASMPGLADWLTEQRDRPVHVHFVAAPHVKSAEAPTTCLRVVRALVPGDVVSPNHVEPANCDETAVRDAFRYDARARATRSRGSLSPGRIALAIPDGVLAGVVPGQRLNVVSHVGAVSVTRTVEAVQSARLAQRVFVRTDDGQVFAAPAPEPAL